jgi:DNA-binding protein H-NS
MVCPLLFYRIYSHGACPQGKPKPGISMDFSPFTLEQLRDVEKQLARELASRRLEELRLARQRIISIAQAAGLPMDFLFGDANLPHATKGRRVPVRYRHPDHPELQWAGRGRMPQWVEVWQTEHGNRDGLLIAANPNQNPPALAGDGSIPQHSDQRTES